MAAPGGAGGVAASTFLELGASSITTTGDDGAYGVESVAQGGPGGPGGDVTYGITAGGGEGGAGGTVVSNGLAVASAATATITTSGQGARRAYFS